MANVFGILTAIVLALAAYTAHQNKDRYESEISKRQEAERTRDKTAATLKQAKSDLADTTKKRKDTEETVSTESRERANLEAANVKLQEQIKEKTDLVASQKAKLDEIKTQLEGVGDLNTIAGTIKATKAAVEELTQSIAAQEGNLANLIAESEKIEKANDALRAISQLYPAKKSSPTLKTRLVAIYPTWGFVTLGAGNNSGVVTNSTLEVVRGGETIAKLLVTAAEGSTASATIVPDSQKADTVLMVGDSVVPAK